jgi:hypothetical protein
MARRREPSSFKRGGCSAGQNAWVAGDRRAEKSSVSSIFSIIHKVRKSAYFGNIGIPISLRTVQTGVRVEVLEAAEDGLSSGPQISDFDQAAEGLDEVCGE